MTIFSTKNLNSQFCYCFDINNWEFPLFLGNFKDSIFRSKFEPGNSQIFIQNMLVNFFFMGVGGLPVISWIAQLF